MRLIEHTVRIYFLFYDASAEVQTYLTSLRREKEGSARITYSQDCGGWFVCALKFFYN
jgi:hypothetical protein